MYKMMKTFVCRGCVNPVTGTGCTSVDIGVNTNLELVDNFCYLGDILSIDKSETWPIRKENEVALKRADMRMVRWLCGVKLQDSK